MSQHKSTTKTSNKPKIKVMGGIPPKSLSSKTPYSSPKQLTSHTTTPFTPLENRLSILESHSHKQHQHQGKMMSEVAKLAKDFADHPVVKKESKRSKFLAHARRALTDSFAYPPPSLGFNSFYPLSRGSAYYKGNFTLNGDGSGYIQANPNFNNFINLNQGNLNQLCSGPTWLPAQNSVVDLASVTDARPLGLTLKVFLDTALTSVPGMVYTGQMDYSFSFLGTTTFTGSTAATNAYCSQGPYPVNIAYSYVSTSTGGADINSTLLGISTNTIATLPCSREKLATKPATVSWRPEDISDVEFNSGYGGGVANEVIIPAQSFSSTSDIKAIGTASATVTTTASPVCVFPGPTVYAAFVGCPAGATVYYEAVYHFEYSSEGKSGPVDSTSGDCAVDYYATPDSYYRDVYKQPEVKAQEHDGDKDSFFAKTGKFLKDVITSPIGEMILMGVTSLFGSVKDNPHRVYRRGKDFLLSTPSGNRYMSQLEVQQFYQEQAQPVIIQEEKTSVVSAEKVSASASATKRFPF